MSAFSLLRLKGKAPRLSATPQVKRIQVSYVLHSGRSGCQQVEVLWGGRPCKVPRIRSSTIFGVKPKSRFFEVKICQLARSGAVLIQLHGAWMKEDVDGRR